MRFFGISRRFAALILSFVLLFSAAACTQYISLESLYGDRLSVAVRVDQISGDLVIVTVGALSNDPPAAKEAEQGEEAGDSSLLEDNSQTFVPEKTPDNSAPAGSQSDSADSESAPEQAESADDSANFAFYPEDEVAGFLLDDKISILIQRGDLLYPAKETDLKTGAVLLVSFGAKENIYRITILADYKEGKQPQESSSPAETETVAAEQLGSAAAVFGSEWVIRNQSFSSNRSDENALRLEKAAITASNLSVQKTKGNTGSLERSRKYGLNSGVLVHLGADVLFKDSEIATKAKGSAGLFVYGAKTRLSADAAVLSTSGEESPALAIGGGAAAELIHSTLQARNEASPAIRLEKGRLSLSDCEIQSNTLESPALEASGTVTAKNCSFTAGPSESIRILSGGSVLLEDCALSGTKKDYQDITNRDLYSVALESKEKASASLTLRRCSLDSSDYDLFRLSGGQTELTLDSVRLGLARGNLFRLRDGADAAVTLSGTTARGTIQADSGCSLKLCLVNGASLYSGFGKSGGTFPVSLEIDETSKLSLTCDTYLASFSGDLSRIETNGFRLFVADKQVKQ